MLKDRIKQEVCIRMHRTLQLDGHHGCRECDLFDAIEKLRGVLPSAQLTHQVRWHLKNIEHAAAALIIYRNTEEDIRMHEACGTVADRSNTN